MSTNPTPAAHIQQIRAAMAARNVTQTQLAAHLGLNQSSISRRLNGTQPWRTDELQAAAEYLGHQLVINLTDAA